MTKKWALMCEVGQALFGDRWTRDLPKALQLAPSDDDTWQLGKWAAGAPIPKGVLDDLLGLATARVDKLQRLMCEIDDAIAECGRYPPAIPRRAWR